MAERTFRGQSYKWPVYTIASEGSELPREFYNVRLFKTESGKHTRIEVQPGGQWHGVRIDYSGVISGSKYSQGEVLFALTSSGQWSGGSNYTGYVFGKPGAIVYFNCKGSKKWLLFTDSGYTWTDIKPDATPKEV